MKVVIIGGVAAGPKAAARLRRLRPEAEITIIEQGELISYGACGLPLYLGNLVPEMEELMMTTSGSVRDPDYFYDTKSVKVLNNTRAEAIDREHKTVKVRNLIHNQEDTLFYDYLVLATGAKPIIPSLPGRDLANVFTLHHPDDAQRLRELVRSKTIKHLTIIGAGLIGMEAADALASPRLQVTICEAKTRVLPNLLDPDMSALVEQQARSQGVEILLSCQVQELRSGDNGKVARVVTNSGEFDTDAVIIAVGVRPEVELACAAGLELGVTGAIKVDSRMQTSDPAIYAGGDCVENYDLVTGQAVYTPLASTANKHGRVIADNIAGRDARFPGVSKTSVLQCFEYNIGRTGLGEEEARDKGWSVQRIVVSGYDTTHYHPMHDRVKIKLIAESVSGRILGAQVVGSGEGIKRLDVLVTAMKYGATLEDIAYLDLGYAPPFSTAIDLVAHTANALDNKISGLAKSVSTAELSALAEEADVYILDVRKPDEIESNPISFENKIEIPLRELNQRWREIPAQAKIITVCELGVRSYEAACTLQGKGLSAVYYLEGGSSILST